MKQGQIERLTEQIAFIVEMDRLKGVLRQSLLTDGSRRENSAEHSWHLAVMTIVLAEHAEEPIDVGRTMMLVLLHDVVEIDAGDTFAYDANGLLDQAEREGRAAQRLFGILPEDQAAALRALWHEFEEQQTPEARFTTALDRLQPLLQNMHTAGGTWRLHNITHDRVLARMQPLSASPRLWAYAQDALERAVESGILAPAQDPALS